MSSDRDDDDSVTGVKVAIDASAIVGDATEPTRRNAVMRHVPARAPDSEPNTVRADRPPESKEGVGPTLFKTERTFTMDLPPTEPAEFPPATQRLEESALPGPRGPRGTVKIVSTPEGRTVVTTVPAPKSSVPAPKSSVPAPTASVPAPTASDRRSAPPEPRGSPLLAPPVQVKPSPRRRGRAFVLALLLALVGAGLVKRSAVAAFVRTTTALVRR